MRVMKCLVCTRPHLWRSPRPGYSEGDAEAGHCPAPGAWHLQPRRLRGPAELQGPGAKRREGDPGSDRALTNECQVISWQAQQLCSRVLSAYFLNKSKTALTRDLTEQNAESFLVHDLFSCRGNLLSSPSQPIKTFTTSPLG